jgi:Protein of unknown function (DUF3592)
VPDLPWYVYAMLLAPLALVLFAAAYKTLQVRAAREWPSTPGKVVISDSEVRDVRVLDDSREDNYRIERRNFADVVYQYSVAGKQLRNNRISIGEDRGNFEVAETIAKYPVGMDVTVFYNPLHPNEAVLERDLPKGLWGCLGIGTAVVLAIVFGGVFGLNRLNGFVAALLAHPKYSPMVVVFGAFGLVIAMFALVMRRQSQLAKHWPVVPGIIRMSDIQQYRNAPTQNGVRGEVMYQRQASVAYTYNNVAYTCIEGSLASGANSTSGWLMRKFTTAYQDGASANVYVNPANPSEATLNPRGGVFIIWILGLLAVAFWGLAYFVATRG